MAAYTAKCACGAIEAELTGSPALQCFCHCTDCRDWLGAPVHAATCWPSTQIKLTKGAGYLTVYKRTDRSHRHSCKVCGSAVFVEHPAIAIFDFLASTIKGFKFSPTMHIFYGERMIDLKDGLPKYRGAPKALGGDDQLMAE